MILETFGKYSVNVPSKIKRLSSENEPAIKHGGGGIVVWARITCHN